MSHFIDVAIFHDKFKLPIGKFPDLLSDANLNLRVDMMLEEIIEFMRAHRSGDLTSSLDALIDLVYFVMGTAVSMGLPWDAAFDAVHRANMRKISVPPEEGGKARGEVYGFEIVKPPNWVGPEGSIARHIEARRNR